MKEVLQKFISASGYCSRRRAEELIRDGKVSVNGEPAVLGMRADASDEVKVFGQVIGAMEEKVYIKLNKPIGYTCTKRSFSGEKNVFMLIGRKERLFIAGRLDKDSRGLILLTNDGDLTQELTHPSFGHEKKYLVTLTTPLKNPDFVTERLKLGIDIGDGDGVVKVKNARYLGEEKFELVLGEGKKRQIRRMFQAMGLRVIDLVRTAIDKLELGDLPEGQWRPLKKKEIEELLKNK